MRAAGISRLLNRRAALQALLAAAACPARAAEAVVDLALVLAIDCSFSVDSEEFHLQMTGLGLAFTRNDVKQAIAGGPLHSIAVAAMQWSDLENQVQILPWTILASDADAEALGNRLAATPRRPSPGGTAVGAALLYSAAMFAAAPAATRRVIDISSDGRSNGGVPASLARDEVVARGITINALAIVNEDPYVDVYYANRVVGGEGHFVIRANDYQAYGDAIARKLIKEIGGPGIA